MVEALPEINACIIGKDFKNLETLEDEESKGNDFEHIDRVGMEHGRPSLYYKRHI